MTDPRALIERFYEAFSRCDGEAMAACYHSEVRFSDPVFVDLSSEEARSMWKMLTGRARDLKVTFSDVKVEDAPEGTADARTGSARWVATYTFSTGRAVRNEVTASFRFADGLIVDHRDTFDLWAWSKQALGLPGFLLGWAPPFQNAVRKKARSGLEAFMKVKGAQ